MGRIHRQKTNGYLCKKHKENISADNTYYQTDQKGQKRGKSIRIGRHIRPKEKHRL